VSHVFKHGAAMMNEVVEILEIGAADVELHRAPCCRGMGAKGRDNMVWGSWSV
jgi:hypothetical protein